MPRSLLSVGLFLATFTSARAGVMSDLSASDQQKVREGGQVMVMDTLDGYPWPRVRVYQAVKATPTEVMAVFTDYDRGREFVPNCLKSKVSKEISPRVTQVDYVIDVPVFADEAYTARNTLSQESGGALRVAWKVLKATSILESEGSLYAEPSGAEGSLIRYTNLVKPSSSAAPLLRNVAMSQMKDTVSAIVGRVQKLKTDPAALQSDLARLNEALGVKN